MPNDSVWREQLIVLFYLLYYLQHILASKKHNCKTSDTGLKKKAETPNLVTDLSMRSWQQ